MHHYMAVVSSKSTFGFLSEIGWAGVDLFFVLSGYLIGNQLLFSIAHKKYFSLKTFYIRRLLRTLPNYYFVLALFYIFPLALSGKETASIWQFLTFTQNLSMRPGATFSHSWSLCIEEQFYLILPIAAILISYTKRSIGLGWLILCGAIGLAMVARGMVWFNYGQNAITGSDFFQHIYYSSFTRFDELLLGVALAMFKNFHTQSYEKVLRYGNVLLVAGVVSVGIMLYLMSQFLATDENGFNFWLTTFGYSLLAMSFSLLTLSALSPHSFLNRIKIPGAASIALWSYAIYLTHKPIFKLTVDPLNQLNINTDSYLGIAIIMVVSVLGGWILYRLVETPFMRMRDKFYSFDNVKSNAGLKKQKDFNIPDNKEVA